MNRAKTLEQDDQPTVHEPRGQSSGADSLEHQHYICSDWRDTIITEEMCQYIKIAHHDCSCNKYLG